MKQVMNKMAAVALIFHPLLWLSLSMTVTYGELTDIHCLRTLRDSLEDPFNYLSSWNFNNNTEAFICKFTGIECWSAYQNRVLYLRLSDMGLKGQFPSGLENCTSLTGLDLSNNSLSGPIPSDIPERLQYLTSLDLSRNSFSGVIPASISNCTYLNALKLDHNQFNGQIPAELTLLSRLKVFSVANNLLSGQIPSFHNSTFQADSYANNLGLCGEPLPLCKGPSKKSHDTFVVGFVEGWVSGAFLVIGVFFSFCSGVSKKKKKGKKKKEAVQGNKRATVKEEINEIKILMPEHLITKISMRDLAEVTNNFSKENIIRSGRTGTMYKARLPCGSFIAIKRFQSSQFTFELSTLGSMTHRNVVPLLGYCISKKERLLVYKYMCNGTLHDRLHLVDTKNKAMGWPLRLRTSIDLARGFAWLHHNCNRCIVHSNISSKCVLFDENFEPKISNFRRARLMSLDDDYSITSMEAELQVFGSIAPEDMQTTEPNPKEDIYSFGLLLLELVTGQKPAQVSNTSERFKGNLVEWIAHLSNSSSSVYNAIDKSLIGKGFDADIFMLLKVACRCVLASPNERPTMFEVYETLRVIGERYFRDDAEIVMLRDSIDVDFLFGLK